MDALAWCGGHKANTLVWQEIAYGNGSRWLGEGAGGGGAREYFEIYF